MCQGILEALLTPRNLLTHDQDPHKQRTGIAGQKIKTSKEIHLRRDEFVLI